MTSQIKMLFLMGLLGFLLKGCAPKSSAPKNLAQWLEQYAPGQYEVVQTHISDPIGNLSLKVKRSIVAEKADPMVQAVIQWDKRDEDLKISSGHVDSAFAEAREAVADIRELQALLAANKCSPCAVGLDQGIAKVLLLDEPHAEYRNSSLRKIASAIRQWRKSNEYALEVLCFDEPLGEYTDLYPLEVWTRAGEDVERRITFRKKYDKARDCRADDHQWAYNTNSNAFYKLLDSVRVSMTAWIEANHKDAISLDEQVEIMPLKDQPDTYVIAFPFTREGLFSKPEDSIADSDGHLITNLNIETGLQTPIRIVKEIPE